MAFNVVLYTFSKKANSTAIPSTAALTVSCQARLPLDIISPTIQLQLTGGAAANPSAYNYAYIASFSRYYWIRTWRNVGPLWEADLTCDVLASWRTNIGSQSCYIYRAAYSFDNKLPDNLYPTTSQIRSLNITLPRMWTVGGQSASGAATNSGCYIAGIISKDGTKWYAFTESAWSLFMYLLYSDQYFEDVLGVFGATEYPEAKVAVNPMQYISSVKWCPVGFAASGTWCIHTLNAVTTINVGVASVTHAGFGTYPVYLLPDNPTVINIEDIDTEASDFLHPQADERGDWLNLSPYTSVELFYPPFGLVQLDPAIISKYQWLRISLTTDCHACSCQLEVYCFDTAAATNRVIYRGVGTFGVDVPVSGIFQQGVSPLTMAASGLSIIGGLASMATGNFVGGASMIIGGAHSAIGSAVMGQVPHLSTMGGPGSTASLAGTPRLYLTQWYMADDDQADRGRPLCKIRTVSALPGYQICDSDHVSIPCTSQELTEIRSVMASGFYYE